MWGCSAWFEYAVPHLECRFRQLRVEPGVRDMSFMHQSGVARTADPLGGSYYVEHLTDALESGVEVLMAEIERGEGHGHARNRSHGLLGPRGAAGGAGAGGVGCVPADVRTRRGRDRPPR